MRTEQQSRGLARPEGGLGAATSPPHLSREAIRWVAWVISRAPSVHNSQPWALEWDGAHLDVAGDSSRRLAVIDPAGRQLHLSCGAAVLHARIALATLGFAVDVELLPVEGHAQPLARLWPHLADGPRQDLAALLPAVSLRRTDRGPFPRRPLPAELQRDLAAAAAAEGATLTMVDDLRKRLLISRLISASDRIETSQAAYRLELERWTCARVVDDGIPLEAGGPGWRGGAGDFRLRDFGGSRPAAGNRELRDEPALAILSTGTEAPADWLRAGQALERVLLVATGAGVAASMLNQPVEIPGARDALRACIDRIGHPQVVLRLGYSQRRPVRTPRRSVDEILTFRLP